MSNTEFLTFEALEATMKKLIHEDERPYRTVFVGPPYEGDYPPDNWPGWWFPQKEYTDFPDSLVPDEKPR